MKTIFYIGDDKDYSDKWLIKTIKKQGQFKVAVFRPSDKNIINSASLSLIINRLYTSAVSKYGDNKVKKLIRKISFFEKKKIPVINSSVGYLLDLDRKKQFDFFSSHDIYYVKTVRLNTVLNHKDSISFPCVMKYNPSGRNKIIKIIHNKTELNLLESSLRKKSILQPLIKKSLCYRTEFIDNWSGSFTEDVQFENNKLYFSKSNKIITTPLSKHFKEKIVNIMRNIGIQAFSIEYFIDKKESPIIVDFNLTSNYHPTFIKETKDNLKKSWINLIYSKCNSQKK